MSRAFTLIELLVTMAVIAVLAGLLIGVVGMLRRTAALTQCNRNLQQLQAAISAYGQSYKSLVPNAFHYASMAQPGADATKQRIVAERGLEVLAAVIDDLPPRTFVCPRDPTVPKDGPALAPLCVRNGNRWDDAWAAGRISYAYDYDAPVRRAPFRALLGDRGANHGPRMSYAASDGSIQSQPISTGLTPDATYATDITGYPSWSRVVIVPQGKGSIDDASVGWTDNLQLDDNIFDAKGDFIWDSIPNYGNTGYPGYGNRRRAWLK